MTSITSQSFGLVIAFLLPGFLLLWGCSFVDSGIAAWLITNSSQDAPSVGGFLLSTLASLAVGLLLSAIRWITLDQYYYEIAKLPKPQMNNAAFSDANKLSAFQAAIDNHYRYYQAYAHTFVAGVLFCAAAAALLPLRESVYPIACAIPLAVALFCKAEDELRTFNGRVNGFMQ